MGQRTSLQSILETKLGSSNVYFQPSSSAKLSYPCIVYRLSDIDQVHADNILYLFKMKYLVTVIDKDPDSSVRDAILQLPLCDFDRHYTADNLNHYVFNLFY